VLSGMEAVIDKDLASALVARQVSADMLLLLTDVDAVYQDFGKSTAKKIAKVGALALVEDQFAAGSMRPKIEAAGLFAIATGRPAAIGRLEDALTVSNGTRGTMIVAGASAIELRS